MSKWRPEGWENPYTVNPQLKDYPKNAFEQGADAMLEAVCKEIEKVENPYRDKGIGFHYDGFEVCRQKILTLLWSKGG